MRRRSRGSSLVGIGAPLIAAALAGCGPVAVEGDFDGVGFFADRTVLAVADRHALVETGGHVLAEKRPEGSETLTLVLTGAQADVDEEWRRLPADRLLDLKKDLATLDGLLLEGIPLGAVVAGESIEVALDERGRVGADPFRAFLVVGLPAAELVREQGLGADVRVKVLFDDVEIALGGHVTGRVEIKRSRREGQEGEVATGEVTLRFSAPLAPERLAKSNLSLLRPVMACAAEAGPIRAGACRDEPPEPFLDATGTVRGP